jgi:uncharacterized delta-60 repeat protein
VLLDSSFGTGGSVLVDIGGPGPFEDEPFWMVSQPDGKLLTAGKGYNRGTGNFDFTLIRYDKDGTLDPTFGWGGIVLTDFLQFYDEGLSVALQTDGKIVVAGRANRPNGQADFAIVRYNQNGSLDTSFGWGGRVMTEFFGGVDIALAIVVQQDGKLVVAGFATRVATGADFAMVRYNTNGSLDTTFGWGGFVTTDFTGSTDAITKLLLQPDGKFVATGLTFSSGNGNFDYAVARYLPDGQLDSSFGWGGLVARDFLADNDVGYSSLLQPDGKIVVGGLAYNPGNASFDVGLARFNENGSLDPTFASSGVPGLAVTDIFGGYDQALWLTLQPDGKILGGGHAVHPSTGFDFLLIRYLPDGSLDTSFGDSGYVTTDFFGGPDGIHALAIQSEGTVIAAGDAFNPNSASDDFALARYVIVDPSWITGVVSQLPQGAFSAGEAGKTDTLSQLALIDADIAASDLAGAILKLHDLRSLLDGCPPLADLDDLIVDCDAQILVANLVDQLINKLGAK